MFIKWVLCKDYISFAEENDLISRENDDNDVHIRWNEFGPNVKEARWTKFIIARSRINNVTIIEDLLYEMRLNRLKKITGPWLKKTLGTIYINVCFVIIEGWRKVCSCFPHNINDFLF